jgi:hypothetical protein
MPVIITHFFWLASIKEALRHLLCMCRTKGIASENFITSTTVASIDPCLLSPLLCNTYKYNTHLQEEPGTRHKALGKARQEGKQH